MVRHVILWKLKEMPDAEKTAVKAGIKEGLEGLAGKIPGLLDVRVYTDALPSSPPPAPVAVADGKVRPYTAVRTCLDFNV